MDTQAADLTPILNVMLAGYLGCSGVLGLALVRPPLQRWYHSGVWYIAGRGPVDILLKQIGSRLSFEAFTFALACIVGALGGWIYVAARAWQPDAGDGVVPRLRAHVRAGLGAACICVALAGVLLVRAGSHPSPAAGHTANPPARSMGQRRTRAADPTRGAESRAEAPAMSCEQREEHWRAQGQPDWIIRESLRSLSCPQR